MEVLGYICDQSRVTPRNFISFWELFRFGTDGSRYFNRASRKGVAEELCDLWMILELHDKKPKNEH